MENSIPVNLVKDNKYLHLSIPHAFNVLNIPANRKASTESVKIAPQKNGVSTSAPISGYDGLHNLYYCSIEGTQLAQLQVKVHLNLLANIVETRHENNNFVKKRTGYRVNKAIKVYAAFYVLKSLTTSGVIQDYAKALPVLTKALGCVNSTFYARLKALKALGLVAVNKGSLILAGYSRVGEVLETLPDRMITVNYDPAKDKFYQLLELAYLGKLQKDQETGFYQRVQNTPELAELYAANLPIVSTDKNIAPALSRYQVHCFIQGHPEYYALMALNPDFNSTARKLRKDFNFKSYKSVAYLKKKLAAKGLLVIEKRKYTSQVRSRVKTAYVSFNAEKNQTVWHRTDALIIAAQKLVF